MKAPRTLAATLVLLGMQALNAAEEAPKVTFADDVFPILENKCVNCHNTDEAKGGLDLASFGATMTGGSGGAVVISEDPKSSRLYTLAAHTEEPIMPPKGTKATDDELKVIANWIAGGLLETKNSKAKKSEKPKLDLTSVSSAGKPDGPPAMPEHLILEPSVVTDRPNAIPALAHSPWAPILAVAGQKQILLYHSQDYELLGVLPYPEGFPQTLSFSPNGAYLFCGGGRAGKSGNVVAWDIKSGERVIEIGKEFDIVLGADVSPDLKQAVMGGPGRVIKLWDTVAGEQTGSIKKHTDWMLTAAYSPDGVIYATGDRNGNLYVWEAATGYEFYTLKGHTLAVTDLDWRMDGNVLGSCSEDGQVMLWEMNGGTQLKKWEAHPGGAQGIDFAPNGNIATVGRDKTVKIWKGDGSAIRTIAASDDVVLSVAYSDDSKRVFAGDIHGNIKGWDVESGSVLASINSNPPPIEQQLAYSEKRIGELTGQLPKLEEGAKAASAELTAARNGLAEIEKNLAATTQARDAQRTEVAQLDNIIKNLGPEIEKLQQEVAAKNAEMKAHSDGMNTASALLKPQQEEALRLAGELAKRESEVQAAKAALDQAIAEAAKPGLPPEQQTQHDVLAAAWAAVVKDRDEANALTATKTAEEAAEAARLAEAGRVLAEITGKAIQEKAAADAARIALEAATAAKAKAETDFTAASLDGKTPPAELVQAREAASAQETAISQTYQTATAALTSMEAAREQAMEVNRQVEAKVAQVRAELAASGQNQTVKADALAMADAAFKPLRDAAAAGTQRIAIAKADATAKAGAFAQVEKARNDAKTATELANSKVAELSASIEKSKAALAPAELAATQAAATLAAKQKELADVSTLLTTRQTEMAASEAAIVAQTKAKEESTATVATVVAKEAESIKSIEVAKAELQNSQYLQKKWQAAAINLTAMRETENFDDMTVKLGDMVVEETEAKNEADQATKARSEAETTLATAKKTVQEGTLALQEKTSSVLEGALELVANRAVAQLREEAIQHQPSADLASASTVGDQASTPSLSESGLTDSLEPAIGVVAAETLSYKTPEEITEEVSGLKTRLSELEKFLESTYIEADKTKTTVVAADEVARETPKVIAERTKAEAEAANELAEAEAERKRQEEALAEQKKRIEELRAKYLAAFPKREG